jgi:hypothetical protein
MITRKPEDEESVTHGTNDRRSALRFPLRREVKLYGLRTSGPSPSNGETVNISSRGVLLRSTGSFRLGEWIEMAISWPARLNQQINLQLLARGPIVRVEEGQVAVEIQQHEFKTQMNAKNGPERSQTGE